VKQFFASFRSAFPDARMDPEHLLADGDFVVGHLRVTGTHQGEFLGVPATGRQVDFPAIDIVRFRDGKGVEHWGVTDVMTMMEQLGAIPGPG
jgi:predicted ester cyclase